jgi:hypothetical protein
VADESGTYRYQVGRIAGSSRFKELGLKSLYLGLSDGARTDELRRASGGEISNEQIWHAYELGKEKTQDMVEELERSLSHAGFGESKPRFNMIWLLDDFSGSGNTYIRFKEGKYKGKIPKIYEHLNQGDLADLSHYEVYLVLYVATQQAIDHIEYWAERFTSERQFKRMKLKVLCPISQDAAIGPKEYSDLLEINERYNDKSVVDKHFRVGGTDDARRGFAACSLPVVLSHNTPNNSLLLLWGPEGTEFPGLFPRVSRHQEF